MDENARSIARLLRVNRTVKEMILDRVSYGRERRRAPRLTEGSARIPDHTVDIINALAEIRRFRRGDPGRVGRIHRSAYSQWYSRVSLVQMQVRLSSSILDRSTTTCRLARRSAIALELAS